MLSYQHAYHAGGPADVHKHAALALLLAHLAKKEKPFTVIDLYAGEGEYDLDHYAAQKTGEYREGIAAVWGAAKGAPPAVQPFLGAVRRLNAASELKRYPGSPALARGFLRDDDRLILNELHKTAFSNLGRWARKDARIGVHKRDGLEALIALVPPTPRRGLVLIDPSYEVKSEYDDVPAKLAEAVRKWREGIFVIWYPALKEARHRAMLERIKQIDAEIYCDELAFAGGKGLLGTGIIVVNPPWQFDEDMSEAGAWLARVLGRTKHAAMWLRRSES